MRQLYHVGKLGFAGLDLIQTARYGSYNQWQAPNLALWFTAGLNDPAAAEPLRTLLADILAGLVRLRLGSAEKENHRASTDAGGWLFHRIGVRA